MNPETAFYLLGIAFSAIDDCRTYFIEKEDTAYLTMLEGKYQYLKNNIDTIVLNKKEIN